MASKTTKAYKPSAKHNRQGGIVSEKRVKKKRKIDKFNQHTSTHGLKTNEIVNYQFRKVVTEQVTSETPAVTHSTPAYDDTNPRTRMRAFRVSLEGLSDEVLDVAEDLAKHAGRKCINQVDLTWAQRVVSNLKHQKPQDSVEKAYTPMYWGRNSSNFYSRWGLFISITSWRMATHLVARQMYSYNLLSFPHLHQFPSHTSPLTYRVVQYRSKILDQP